MKGEHIPGFYIIAIGEPLPLVAVIFHRLFDRHVIVVLVRLSEDHERLVEPPQGDFIRQCTPYGLMYQGEGLNYLSEGRNKFHITLNLEKPQAREMLKRLAAQVDVLVETYPPGVMDAWGIGYEVLKQINPRLIFASISAHGQFGLMSHLRMPDYDNIIQARSANQYDTGEILPQGMTYDERPWAVPTKAGPWIGSAQAGTFMAVGILAALHHRELTGEGQALDVASAESYASLEDWASMWYQGAGVVNERYGSLNTGGWLYCFAPTKNGAVFLGGLRLEMWQAFADMVGKWDEWGAASWKDLASFSAKEVQLKWAELVFAETRKYTNEQLVDMSLAYTRQGRLALARGVFRQLPPQTEGADVRVEGEIRCYDPDGVGWRHGLPGRHSGDSSSCDLPSAP